jgi:vitamin B12 transporter
VQRPEDAATGAPLLRRAEESASLALTRRIGSYEVGLQILATGDRRDFGDVVLPGYLLANITGRLQLGPRWVLRVRLENALDRDYELVDGYNTAGRGLYAGLAYNY